MKMKISPRYSLTSSIRKNLIFVFVYVSIRLIIFIKIKTISSFVFKINENFVRVASFTITASYRRFLISNKMFFSSKMFAWKRFFYVIVLLIDFRLKWNLCFFFKMHDSQKKCLSFPRTNTTPSINFDNWSKFW